jgi:hypothetical protein
MGILVRDVAKMFAVQMLDLQVLYVSVSVSKMLYGLGLKLLVYEALSY